MPLGPVGSQQTGARPAVAPPLALASLIALLLAGPATAALTEVDDPSLPASPDGFNLTQDDVTGLEWLDLTVTAGRTYDDIVGNDGSDELGPGGDFEGFRYATDLEVTGWAMSGQIDSLFSNFGFSSTFFYAGGYALVRDFLSYLGCFGSCGTYGFAQGLCLDDADLQTKIWFKAEAFPSQGLDFGSLLYASSPMTSQAVNGSVSTSGHFLVRELPEPSSSLMLAPGLLLLAGLQRRRASRWRARHPIPD